MATTSTINTRKMLYSGSALAALKSCHLPLSTNPDFLNDSLLSENEFKDRVWSDQSHTPHPLETESEMRRIGYYPLTSGLASWVQNAFAAHNPSAEVIELVRPFAEQFHALMEKERAQGTGLHDLNLIELTYQITFEVGGALLLAATAEGDVVDNNVDLHSSRAAKDDHFTSWGKLLTGLECDPPMIAQFPFYLMMCQSFGLETNSSREDYIYSALTGVDWAKGKNAFSERFEKFEMRARSAIPGLDDTLSGQDRSFWRISLAYLSAMNSCENARPFKNPRTAAIQHNMDLNLVIATRAFDTIGTAYMCSDGAAFLDNAGLDSLIGSAVPNDVMDLHTDMLTGETRNLLRFFISPRPHHRSIFTHHVHCVLWYAV